MGNKLKELVFPRGLYCGICGKYIDNTRPYCLCDHCIKHMNFGCSNFTCSPYFDYGFCAMGYGLYERRLVFNLKYDGKTYLASIIADIMYDAIYSQVEKGKTNLGEEQEAGILDILKADLMIPVPIHKRRLYERGFNQSEKIAMHLGKKMAIEVDSKIMRRDVHTHTQRALSAKERKLNMEGAFSVRRGKMEVIKDKNIIIVDDIYTTGATITSCAKVLKECGAKKIYFITLLFAGNRHHLMVK